MKVFKNQELIYFRKQSTGNPKITRQHMQNVFGLNVSMEEIRRI